MLRLKPGDIVHAFDGSGKEYSVSLDSPDCSSAQIQEILNPDTEPQISLTLVQSLPKGDKIELVLQKGTEIGVSQFIIVESARSIPHVSADKLTNRLQRWQSIVIEAAEQSGRLRVPPVDGIYPLKNIITRTEGCKLIAWEYEHENMLVSKLKQLADIKELILFIGPEGGFTEEEIQIALQSGVQTVSLGKRILRTETAAIVSSALVILGSE